MHIIIIIIIIIINLALLVQTYVFVPIAVETMGAINSDGLEFLGDLRRRITQVTSASLPSCSSAYQFLFSATMRSPSRAPFAHTTSEDEF